jgi:hypothetical protein
MVRKFDCVLLNSGAEECFHRRSKVESQHPRTQRPHTSCVGASGRILLLFLLARIGIEAISKPGKQLIVEVHARGVNMLSELPDHHDKTARINAVCVVIHPVTCNKCLFHLISVTRCHQYRRGTGVERALVPEALKVL